ncbi:MAG: ABC transporter ATP-binding protein [Cytophagales bacterium]|nr:ABC transporter ATP-binding protein [Bernardetiaceae bacterium]MDW8205865.1 ABC transporter ATP-binding protein [Cytophagales bacterium]
MSSIIRTVNLGKVYTSGNIETIALRDINLTVREGEFVSIMGPSGCGKSTLLHLLALMDKPSSGELYFMEQPTTHLSDKQRAALRRYYIGFVFQSFNLIEELTVAENIALPLIYQRIPEAERIRRVNQVMEQLDVAHKGHFYPMQLSGGHQQRVAVARAIVARPRILFADEPTGNLDSQHGLEVMEILSDLNHEQGTTIVMVTHSPQYAEFSQRTIHLFDGQVVSGAISQFR